MAEVNNTATANVLTPDLALAYTAIVTMAVIPIYLGSFMSITKTKTTDKDGKEEKEIMTKKDAYMFPVIGSGVLIGLYLLFRLFSKEYVNLLLTAYFLFFGFLSLVESLTPIVKKYAPQLDASQKYSYAYRFPWEDKLTETDFTHADIASWALSGLVIVWYAVTKNWIANNILGLSFSIQGISLINLGSYQNGCILLGGLFIYDIFWVFGTDVMVTVAKSFDAPIKLLFPKSFFAETYSYTMLGLGDIVIPGVFIALLLRYDFTRVNAKLSKMAINIPFFSNTPYFGSTLIGYTVGLVTTIFVMHTFKAAQPALLYLVPTCIGFSSLQALLLNDLSGLYAYDEAAADEKTSPKTQPKQEKPQLAQQTKKADEKSNKQAQPAKQTPTQPQPQQQKDNKKQPPAQPQQQDNKKPAATTQPAKQTPTQPQPQQQQQKDNKKQTPAQPQQQDNKKQNPTQQQQDKKATPVQSETKKVTPVEQPKQQPKKPNNNNKKKN
eukprot:TRINITY_DN330_c0_g1_i1.p1 TRINITY_DN330_c0_g1~~TRINITY_DN330_c0_g1_i1.p1  ORF type:complete len:502 (-),score=168.95 TRINITY_DN330_c0_g1_i1:56-1537(-)